MRHLCFKHSFHPPYLSCTIQQSLLHFFASFFFRKQAAAAATMLNSNETFIS